MEKAYGFRAYVGSARLNRVPWEIVEVKQSRPNVKIRPSIGRTPYSVWG